MSNNRIKELRNSKRISLRALSQETGLDWSTICAMENGRREVNMRFAEKLSDYFNVSVDYLLGRCSKPHSTKESEETNTEEIESNTIKNQTLKSESKEQGKSTITGTKTIEDGKYSIKSAIDESYVLDICDVSKENGKNYKLVVVAMN